MSTAEQRDVGEPDPSDTVGGADLQSLLAAIVESSNDAILSKDLNGIVTSWNAAAERIFGFSAAEMIGQPILKIIPDDLLNEEMGILSRIRAGERVDHFDTVRRRKDGLRIPVSATISPVRDRDGNSVGASTIVRDISERRRLEEAQRVLSREVNHRSKNLLAVVQSIIRYTVSHSPQQDFVRRINERLRALSANQDLLIESSWRGADMAHLVRSQLSNVERIPLERVGVTGEAIFLVPTAAQALGMALHELATNAVKFGALSDGTGRVEISWRLDAGSNGRTFIVSWQESGGPAVAAPEYAGFGTTIIERITGQSLAGRVSTIYAPTGLTWELRAPADALIVDPAAALARHL